ncbi:MAG: hypothetical protein P8Q36_10060 [Alphaproteobacteria bacterium]|nr:hypothetical protein [Rhodospirillaceae bacterium]MBT7646614.1 hypothetical protein [Rhodospirillaceae bacterium]MDG2481193.1 hypothetical protein [Alphaproteobacteria bacterium]
MGQLVEPDFGNQRSFRVEPLSQDNVLQAYALASLHDDHISLEAWQATVEQSRGREHDGWAIVTDRRGYIHALFRYSVRQESGEKKMLAISDVVSAGLGRKHALTEIRSWSKLQAGNFGCDWVEIANPVEVERAVFTEGRG